MFSFKKSPKELYDLANKFFENGEIDAGYASLLRAAKGGYAEAQYDYGNAILEHKVPNTEMKDGVKWLEKAASQNHVFALNNLAMCYQTGIAVEINPTKAYQLLLQADSHGDLMAAYNLAQALILGIGVKKDILKGMEYAQKAASTKNPLALFFIGDIYSKGIKDEDIEIEPNKDLAISYLAKGAEQGDSDCIKRLQELGIKMHGNQNYFAEQFMQIILHRDLSYLPCLLLSDFKYTEISNDPYLQGACLLNYEDIGKEGFISVFNKELNAYFNTGTSYQARATLDKENHIIVDMKVGDNISSFFIMTENSGIKSIFRINNPL